MVGHHGDDDLGILGDFLRGLAGDAFVADQIRGDAGDAVEIYRMAALH